MQPPVTADLAAEQSLTIASAWAAYRAACFIRPGPMLVWVWSAAHDFDLAVVGLHLENLPGARLDLGAHALALRLAHLDNLELDEWHLVPLTRLTSASIDALRPSASDDLAQTVHRLRGEQRAAEAELGRQVMRAHLCRLLPGTPGGARH